MHGRDREELAQDAGAEQGEQDLQNAGRHADAQSHAIAHGVGGIAVAAEVHDAANGDDDEAGRGPLDRQLRVADERRQDAADDGGEDAGDGRIARRGRDAQAQRQRNQEDKKARQQIQREYLASPCRLPTGTSLLSGLLVGASLYSVVMKPLRSIWWKAAGRCDSSKR